MASLRLQERGWGLGNNMNDIMGTFHSTMAESWMEMPLQCDNSEEMEKYLTRESRFVPCLASR